MKNNNCPRKRSGRSVQLSGCQAGLYALSYRGRYVGRTAEALNILTRKSVMKKKEKSVEGGKRGTGNRSMNGGKKLPVLMVSKPCYELGYCPYGPLVEEFELPRRSGNKHACILFGHKCPVFEVAQDIRKEDGTLFDT